MQSNLIDPSTGNPLEPIGYRNNGSPIWPILGGSGENEPKDEPETEDEPEADPEGEDEEPGAEWDEARARRDMHKKNRENQNLRKRVTALEAAEAELKDMKRGQLSKEERLAAENEESRGSLASLKRDNALLRIRIETGLTERQAKRLAGSDYDELLEDAKELLEDLASSKSEEEPPAKKRPAAQELKTGSEKDEDDEDIAAIVAKSYRRRF